MNRFQFVGAKANCSVPRTGSRIFVVESWQSNCQPFFPNEMRLTVCLFVPPPSFPLSPLRLSAPRYAKEGIPVSSACITNYLVCCTHVAFRGRRAERGGRGGEMARRKTPLGKSFRITIPHQVDLKTECCRQKCF